MQPTTIISAAAVQPAQGELRLALILSAVAFALVGSSVQGTQRSVATADKRRSRCGGVDLVSVCDRVEITHNTSAEGLSASETHMCGGVRVIRLCTHIDDSVVRR